MCVCVCVMCREKHIDILVMCLVFLFHLRHEMMCHYSLQNLNHKHLLIQITRSSIMLEACWALFKQVYFKYTMTDIYIYYVKDPCFRFGGYIVDSAFELRVPMNFYQIIIKYWIFSVCKCVINKECICHLMKKGPPIVLLIDILMFVLEICFYY